MGSETYQRHRDLLELARGFMPYNPVEARWRVAEVLAAVKGAKTAVSQPELEELQALAEAMHADYARAAEAWQAESARRAAQAKARQLAVLAGRGKP